MTRPHIEKAYGFVASSSRKSVQKNKERYLELMAERSFHYKVGIVVIMGIHSPSHI